MIKLLPLFIATAVLLVFRNFSTAGTLEDSLTFVGMRHHVRQNDPTNQALLSAEALFEAKLFSDAVALLQQHATAKTAAAPAVSKRLPHATIQWRTSTGIDYYHLEDLDTVTMTAEELRDYRRLTETPHALWLRAKASIRYEHEVVENIDPEVYLSQSKGRVATTARFILPGGRVRIEPSVKGEKWFKHDASNDTSFSLFNKQPSDMGGAALRFNFENATTANKKIRFSIPVSIDWEHYRDDKPSYESFIEYRLLPALEIRAEKLPFLLRFSGLVEFENYYRPLSDALDVLRLSCRVEGSKRDKKQSTTISAAWMGDRYTKALSLGATNRYEGTFRGEQEFLNLLITRLKVRGIYEQETYLKGSMDFSRATGTELTACPGLDFLFFGKQFRAGPDFLWEQRIGGKTIDRSVWQGRSAMEPGLRTGWSGNSIDASMRAAYRSELFDTAFKEQLTTEDNRSLRCEAELSVSPRTFLSIDLFADYQYRLYAPYNEDARVSENITISASITARW